MILVIGGTGNVGRVLVDMLCNANESVRVVTRDARRASRWTGRVDVIQGDVREQDTLQRALEGTDRIFSLCFVESPNDLDRGITESARDAGVRHVTKLSSIGATAAIPIGERHRACEEWVLRSGMGWTLLRAGYFMANTLRWVSEIRSASRVTTPVPDGLIAPISEVDLAAVAFRSLVEDGHQGRIYELTGDALISARQQVATLSKVLHTPIACVELDVDSALRQFAQRGAPSWLTESRRAMLTSLADGRVEPRTTTFEDLMGRQPMTYEEWAELHRAEFV